VVFLSRMDLVQQVIGNLEISEDKAEKGIGALLMALRASLDRVAFDGVKAALPHSERLMGRALMSPKTRPRRASAPC